MPITHRALFQRLSRKLTGEGERLMTCRENSPAFRDVGRYYTVNERNHIARADIDLERLGRDLGVMQEWEVLTA